jgi:hypothetical protein
MANYPSKASHELSRLALRFWEDRSSLLATDPLRSLPRLRVVA